jgi:hypothetical protein
VKIDAWIRYYFKEDADKLDEDKFWLRWSQLKFCLKKLGLYE